MVTPGSINPTIKQSREVLVLRKNDWANCSFQGRRVTCHNLGPWQLRLSAALWKTIILVDDWFIISESLVNSQLMMNYHCTTIKMNCWLAPFALNNGCMMLRKLVDTIATNNHSQVLLCASSVACCICQGGGHTSPHARNVYSCETATRSSGSSMSGAGVLSSTCVEKYKISADWWLLIVDWWLNIGDCWFLPNLMLIGDIGDCWLLISFKPGADWWLVIVLFHFEGCFS